MTRQFFGTDGVRGRTNTPPMDAASVQRIGMAAGAHFRKDTHRHRVVIGKDTRLSGYMVEPALTSGLISMGLDVFLVGPMPTSGVAIATRSLRADLGIMISASHNPFHDNGVKFFNARGEKLTDDIERDIEKLMQSDLSSYLAAPEDFGRAKRLEDATGRYVQFVKNTIPRHVSLEGFKIVVDCAHGAAYKLAPMLLWELGADVISIGVEPNGFNINQGCGSTHPELLQQKVKEHQADIGIALDGDADRLIIVDEQGALVDGDKIMAAIALDWKARDRLAKPALVTTVMSNLAMERYLNAQKLELIRTQVGDRYVIEAMRSGGYNFGGEQSGHLIFGDYATTGDGLIAALQVLAILAEQQRPASELLHPFTPLPQLLHNVRFDQAIPSLENDKITAIVTDKEKLLGDTGRILLRKSGTEPLVRIMVEGEDDAQIKQVAADIAEVIEAA